MSYYEIEPARAKNKNAENLWDDPEWIAEEKLDGWRFLMHFGDELPRTFLTGRRISSETGFLSEKGLCAKPLWPSAIDMKYTVIDGEVMPPEGSGFRDIAGIMNTNPEKAARKIAEIGPPRYFAFDVLYADGVDIRDYPLLERQQILARIVPTLQNSLITQVPARRDSRAWYESIVDGGGEGVILKNIASPYGEGWVKVKRYSTLDVVITGFTDARVGRTGKYVGQIGAAIVSVYGRNGNWIEVGKVSGMRDDIRIDMSLNPSKWIGTVIEVAAQEFAKERLRHPRFKRARPESDPRHATFDKMMSDLGRQIELPDDRQRTFGF